MTDRILIDNYILDAETGEIIDAPKGTDKARLAAFRLTECKEQIAEWEKDAAIWAAAVKRHQPTKSAEYTDAVDTTIRTTISEQTNQVVDVVAFKQWVLTTELTRDDLQAIVLASTAGNWRTPWKTDALPEPIRDAMADVTHERIGEAFVKVSRSKKAAPKATVEPDPDALLQELEESLASERAKREGVTN